MCHYRGSSVSNEAAQAEAERRKEMEAKRNKAVDTLLREAGETAQKTAPKETAPAK